MPVGSAGLAAGANSGGEAHLWFVRRAASSPWLIVLSYRETEVDQRAGGMGMKGAASFQWGDAQNAMDYWAQKIPNRVLQLQGKSPQS